jgi:hypothetical protein
MTVCIYRYIHTTGKGKVIPLQAYVAQRVGRGIALLFLDRGTRRGWVVSSTPRPHLTPRKDPVPILQEVGWAPGPVWMGGKSRPHRDSIPDRPARSQTLYRLSYPAHIHTTALYYWPNTTGMTHLKMFSIKLAQQVLPCWNQNCSSINQQHNSN